MRKETLHSSLVKHLASMNEEQLCVALSCVAAIERQDASVWQKLKPEALENVYAAYHDSFSETNLVSEPDLNALSKKWRAALNSNKQP